MNKSWLLVATLALGACTYDPVEIDLDPDGMSAVVYDDGVSLRVAGCPDREFLGCSEATALDSMTVTADGVTYQSADRYADELPDTLLGLFRDGPLKVSLPRPASGVIDVTINGVQTHVLLPDRFAVTVLPAQIERSAGPLELGHDGDPDGRTEVVMISTCGNNERVDLFEETEPGAFALTFDSFMNDGTCTHEIHVDETVSVAGTDIGVTTVRIQKRMVTSTP